MPTFKTTSEMENYIKSKMQVALVKTQDKIHEVIEKYIAQFYGEWSPEYYERTYQLFNSLVRTECVSTGNGYTISVYLDADRMNHSKKFINMEGRIFSGANQGWDEKTILSTAATGAKSHGGWVSGTKIWTDPMKNELSKKQMIATLKKMLIEAGLPVK